MEGLAAEDSAFLARSDPTVTPLWVLAVALARGFFSLANFNHAFPTIKGRTPSACRADGRRSNEDALREPSVGRCRGEPTSTSWRSSAAGPAIADCAGCCAGKDVRRTKRGSNGCAARSACSASARWSTAGIGHALRLSCHWLGRYRPVEANSQTGILS